MNIAIIGGGAAGFFSALNVKHNFSGYEVTIFEKSNKVLSKLKISGGGRCNVTNGCSISDLAKAYPRGEKQLKKAFKIFSNKDTMQWFEKRDVPLVIQADNCVFPKSQDSGSIIACFTSEMHRLGVKLLLNSKVNSILKKGDKIGLKLNEENDIRLFDKVIVTTGGSPKRKGLTWLEEIGHKIEQPVPSLFTFNMPQEDIRNLMGIVVENAIISFQGSKLKGDGPLLITHWGMSGPAVLKLSSYGARIMNEKNYEFKINVNWIGIKNQTEVSNELYRIALKNPKKQISNLRPFDLPIRLWLFLLNKKGISTEKKWGELGKKGTNKLTTFLTNDEYAVKGKTTFREEFVTCGGVSLESVNFNTMQSKVFPNLYFAGEVLDIDGITGGYNFQAAWTTGFIAAKLLPN